MTQICHPRPLSDWEAFDLLPAEVREYIREHLYCPIQAYYVLHRLGWTIAQLLDVWRAHHTGIVVAQYYLDMERGFLQPGSDN